MSPTQRGDEDYSVEREAANIVAGLGFGDEQATAMQRVREFLAQRYGSIWCGAAVDSYASHESVIHAASLPGVRALSIVIVVERNDGSLSCAVPLPPEIPLSGEEELY